MKQPPTHFRRCPECEAENEASSARCWLCYRPLGKQADIAYAEAIPEPRKRGNDSMLTALTIATLLLALLFILGALRSQPGMALIVAVCTTPAIVSIALLTFPRKGGGQAAAWRAPAALVASSFSMVLLGITAVVAVVSMMVASFFASLGGICTICSQPATKIDRSVGGETAPREDVGRP